MCESRQQAGRGLGRLQSLRRRRRLDRLEIRAEENVKALVIPAYQPSAALLDLLQDAPHRLIRRNRHR